MLLFATAVPACTPGAGHDYPKLEAQGRRQYKLAVGDRLRVSVFGHPKLSGKFQVDGGGKINFPLLGGISASGRTVETLKQVLKTQLNENYLVDPKVSVEVLNYRPFFILGEIDSPGQYEYEPDLSVRQAIAMAGGFTRRAARRTVILRRPSSDGMKTYRANLDAKILPGDTIEVRQRLF
jgi:polysaccharide export outer membrane protein